MQSVIVVNVILLSVVLPGLRRRGKTQNSFLLCWSLSVTLAYSIICRQG